MDKIAYLRPDGGVSIVHPHTKKAIESDLGIESGSMSQKAYEAHVRERSIPKEATNVVDIATVDLPPMDEFRDAWALSSNKIVYDLAKAKDIQLSQIRNARALKLSALDVSFMQAIEKGDVEAQKTIVASKEVLRNITEPLKALKASTIDDIKNAYPSELST